MMPIDSMTDLEAKARDCIENHTHRLIEHPTEQDIYTREESIYISGYKQRDRELRKLIDNMKADVRGNIKWADQQGNPQMYMKLNSMINQWEEKHD